MRIAAAAEQPSSSSDVTESEIGAVTRPRGRPERRGQEQSEAGIGSTERRGTERRGRNDAAGTTRPELASHALPPAGLDNGAVTLPFTADRTALPARRFMKRESPSVEVRGRQLSVSSSYQ